MVTIIKRDDNYPMDRVIVEDRYRKDAGDVSDLASSIDEIGLIHPIVVDEKGHLFVGGRRFLAHEALERKTIRADIIRSTDDITKLTIERDENATRKDFTWVEAIEIEQAIFAMKKKKDPKWTQTKHAEARGVSQPLVNMRLQLAEAFALLPELKEHETQDEAWKEYKDLEEAATIHAARKATPDNIKQAPRWAEDHYIVGNCFEGMAACGNQTFDFAEVDPPYAIEIDRRKGRNKAGGQIKDYNEVSPGQYHEMYPTLADEVYRLLKPNTFAVFWYALQHHHFTYEALVGAGFIVNPIPALWYKGQSGQTAQPDIALASCYEPFFLARKGKPRMARQGRSNVFHYAPVGHSAKIHITQKPLDLIKDMMDTILFPGSNVLVPFLGSGVTLRAAYALGHTGTGWDLSNRHKDRFLELVASEHGGQ